MLCVPYYIEDKCCVCVRKTVLCVCEENSVVCTYYSEDNSVMCLPITARAAVFCVTPTLLVATHRYVPVSEVVTLVMVYVGCWAPRMTTPLNNHDI